MIQWVTENTRYREDKPSRFDLLFTIAMNLDKVINYECPFESSENVEIEKKGEEKEELWESTLH